MTCAEIQRLLPEYALQMLDPRHSTQVADHLADACPNCQQEFEELATVLTLLAEADVQSGASIAPPAELKAKLFSRIAAPPLAPMHQDDLAESAAPFTFRIRKPQSAAPRRSSKWWGAIPYVAATVAAFAVGAAIQMSVQDPRETAADREARYRARMAQIEKSFDTTRVRMAALHPDAVETESRGAAVWDGATNDLHLFAFDVPVPLEGKELVIWLIRADGQHTAAGRLALNSAGDAAQIVEVSRRPTDVKGVVVTEEPIGTMPDSGQTAEPTGPTRLVAKFGH